MSSATQSTRSSVMNWAALAPFVTTGREQWLAPFVDTSRHRIQVIRPDQAIGNWHTKKKGTTDLSGWLGYQRFANRAWGTRPDGLITVFPQLAITAGLRKRLAGQRIPIVAWCLNIGKRYQGLRRSLAQFALQSVDCFVVHARRECEHYSENFGLPRERFEFVPLQHGYIEPTHAEDEDRPFLLSMGSANRDYRTFIEAIRPLKIRTILVASPRCLEGLDLPDFVEVCTGLSLADCQVLAQQARLSVVPIDNDDTASGQVTVIEAMWLGRPLIATRCLGTEDYVDSGTDGYLVPPRDPESLRQTIDLLWHDAKLRNRLGPAARERALAQYSDEMAGAALTRILDRFCR